MLEKRTEGKKMNEMILKGNKVANNTGIKLHKFSRMESPHEMGAGKNRKEAFALETISLDKQLQDPRIFIYLTNFR